MIYNSIRSPTYDAYIRKEVNKFAELVPNYLAMSQFYKSWMFEKNMEAKYNPNIEFDPFGIVNMSNLPQQYEESV